MKEINDITEKTLEDYSKEDLIKIIAELTNSISYFDGFGFSYEEEENLEYIGSICMNWCMENKWGITSKLK